METPLKSLFYVSHKRDAADEAVTDIVRTSRVRNASLDVTGALVSSRVHFAQILEGPEAAVAELMESIRRDPRHADVEVLREEPIDRRVFPTWSLAYAGLSTYVAKQLGELLMLEGDARVRRTARVAMLIAGLAGVDIG